MSATDQIPMGNHHEKMKAMRAALKMHELSTPDEMKDRLKSLRALCGQAPHADAMVHGVSLGDYLHPLREMLDLPGTSTAEEILDACEEMIEAAVARHEAEYHPMNGEGGTALNANEDPLVKLGQAQEQLKSKDTEIRTLRDAHRRLTAEKAAVDLQLKDATAKVAEHVATIATLQGDVAKLKADEDTRAEAEVNARVEDAFATYKDTKKLTADDKEAMLLTAKTKPELFAKLYPVVPPDQRHLMRNLTGARTPTGATAPHAMGDRPLPLTAPGAQPNANGTAAMNHVEMVALADRLKSKGVPNAIATTYAFCQARGLPYTGPQHEGLPS